MDLGVWNPHSYWRYGKLFWFYKILSCPMSHLPLPWLCHALSIHRWLKRPFSCIPTMTACKYSSKVSDFLNPSLHTYIWLCFDLMCEISKFSTCFSSHLLPAYSQPVYGLIFSRYEMVYSSTPPCCKHLYCNWGYKYHSYWSLGLLFCLVADL